MFHLLCSQRDSEMCLVDLFPFAVDAECFRQRFNAHVAGVKEELVSYLSGRRQGCSISCLLREVRNSKLTFIKSHFKICTKIGWGGDDLILFQYGAQRHSVSELERTIDEHLDGKK